ncbi:MAG: ABC transporter permease [Peptostreptococcaceae bacterium]
MGSKLIKKLAQAIGLIFVIISINFFLVKFMPGDPIIHILGEEQYFQLSDQYPEVIEEIRVNYALDGTLFEQYIRYIYNTISLDFGKSHITGELVLDKVMYRMQWTFILIIPAILLSAVFGGILGVIAGYKKGSKIDSILTTIFLFLETVPTNSLALIFLVLFSYKLRVFPIGGMTLGGLEGIAKTMDIIWHMMLPLLVLTIFKTSSNFLLVKSFVSQIKDEDYINTAISKGVSSSGVLFKHVLRNVMVPYITMICMQFGNIISGSMMVEVVFSWKGMGTLIYDSVIVKDFPTIQLCFLLISVFVIFFNFIADSLCLIIDPRIKDGVENG